MIRNFFGLTVDKFEYLSIVFATPYSEEKFNRLVKEFVETDKWEGLIFRKMNVPYKSGRSTDLIKFKLFKDAEYRVIDVEITEKPMLNAEGKMVPTKCVGALAFELENGSICRVGTGISDEQRLAWFYNPAEIIGKQIQVKYKEKTKILGTNNEEIWSLQFPVLVHIFDEDRDF
jgi:DNA ligase-1